MKKETWKMVIQILVSILTAMGTALGTTSCMGHGPLPLKKERIYRVEPLFLCCVNVSVLITHQCCGASP